MDEKLQKKIIRQLRAIRFWLGVVIMLMIAGFALLGFLLFKTSGVLTNTQDQLRNIESQTNSAQELKKKVCSNGLVPESTFCTN